MNGLSASAQLLPELKLRDETPPQRAQGSEELRVGPLNAPDAGSRPKNNSRNGVTGAALM